MGLVICDLRPFRCHLFGEFCTSGFLLRHTEMAKQFST